MVVGVDSSEYEENDKLFRGISFCASQDNASSIYVNKKATTTIEYYDNTYIFIATFMEITLSE